MSDALQVRKRDTVGKRNARRMRADGQVPAVIYGHGEECLRLTVEEAEINAALRHGSQVVELQGELSEQALIKDIQWDTFGQEVLHLDFMRVKAGEKVEVTVPIELRGVAPGVREGGIVEQPLHELEIECPAMSIPEKLQVTINDLHLDQSISIADMIAEKEIPEDVKVLMDLESVVVQCVEPQEEIEEEAGAEGVEPELIGRDEEEGEEASGDD